MQAKHGNYHLDTWDDGFGPLWVLVESLGPIGVIRAQTWGDAWSAAVDEILPDADPNDPDTYARSYDESADPEDLAEGCHYRGSGIPSNPKLRSPIAREDLNGCRLVPLDEWNRDAMVRCGMQPIDVELPAE